MPPNNTYFVGPCVLCDQGITLRHFPEAVVWGVLEPSFWHSEKTEVRAHRFCWKTISEESRERIRKEAPRGWKPWSMGRPA